MTTSRLRTASAICVLAIMATSLGALTTSASAAPGPSARGSWTMVPQSKDANGDGVIDGDGGVPSSGALSRQPSRTYVGAGNHIAQPNERLIGGSLSWYLSKKGFPVRLDACPSTGNEYRWIVKQGRKTVTTTAWRPLTKKKCRVILTLPEDRYTLRLEVRSGGRTARDTITAKVRNLLVLSLGDSYASGEGNPRNVEAWLREGFPFAPYWDADGCNRSARSGPALAALALENASAKSSVTLVDVSCSGATVDRGILGPQSRTVGAQVEQATQILDGRAADLVLLSIGGNDVGFVSILQSCALSQNCPLSTPPSGPLRSSATVQQGVQAQTAELPGDYARIAACLGSDTCTLADGRTVPGIAVSEGGRVMPTLYPDITRAANGQSCRYLTITPQDFMWARDTVLLPTPANPYPYTTTSGSTVNLPMGAGSLNQQIAATSSLGWSPIIGTWSASGAGPAGHGVCAGSAAWVFGITALAGFSEASFHPNPAGQTVLAEQILAAAAGALRP